jgi:hypothetical protein
VEIIYSFGLCIIRQHSRLEPLGVPWEEGSTSNVVQLQEKHEHSLEADASTSMGRASHTESIDIALHTLWINTLCTHLLAEELRVMDTLCPRKNFLATHEEVIGVSEGLDRKNEHYANTGNFGYSQGH